MKLKNRYFVLRHGETSYQRKRKSFIYPWPDKPPVKLTKKGEKEIKKVAKKLKRQKIDLIYSSDIFRTHQTAKIIAKELGLKIIFDSRLRDVNLGIYHGKMKEEFYRDFPRDFKIRFQKRLPQGESWQDVQKRMLNFLKEIDKKYQGKTILIISHGDPLWLLKGAVKGLTSQELLKNKYKNLFLEVGEFKKL